MAEEKKTVTLRLSPQAFHRFDLLRDRLYMSDSQLANYAVESYLNSLDCPQVVERVIRNPESVGEQVSHERV